MAVRHAKTNLGTLLLLFLRGLSLAVRRLALHTFKRTSPATSHHERERFADAANLLRNN
jgi:hypothetical protein